MCGRVLAGYERFSSVVPIPISLPAKSHGWHRLPYILEGGYIEWSPGQSRRGHHPRGIKHWLKEVDEAEILVISELPPSSGEEVGHRFEAVDPELWQDIFSRLNISS